MKVKELIEELGKFDPELEVGIYHGVEEADGSVYSVDTMTSERHPYTKGDSIFDDGDIEKAVIIFGE